MARDERTELGHRAPKIVDKAECVATTLLSQGTELTDLLKNARAAESSEQDL